MAQVSVVKQIGPSSEKTRGAILDLIRSSGTVSRNELVELSGLTGASITRIVKALIEAGLVIETGYGDSTGGKRPTLLELNPRSRYAVGLSLDDAHLTYAVTDLGGRLVGRLVTRGTGQEAPGAVIERVAGELELLLAGLQIDRASVVGIGVAGAGLDIRSRAERASLNAEEWENFAVRDALAASSGLPVVRENDAACAAIGQFWVGRLSASQDFATLYMATGFGCGIVEHGSLARGASSNVGEIGHMVLEVDGPPCWCGSRGCLEMLAAPRRVISDAMAVEGLAAELGLSGAEADVRHDFSAVGRAAAQGHTACVALIEGSARYVAQATLSVVNLLDLDRVYLAGPGFAEAGPIYLRVIRDAVGGLARVRDIHRVEVVLSDPARDAAAVGAASLALQQSLTPHARVGRS
ncbi:ROK family transcriptional regulator [Pseudolysinimonas kribbensis]|uniref:Sugar kinase n=1 Tax=Pseudolysinimonas kribbensis TaxID=433641 RepID=A0ABQ6K5D2_9MICO|nr:ROK family transcriptional regulator [Pseudolysinimonas kribbensis]GMA95633.1 sugar kinase [Pseudolysinimonas kribbensis]